MCWQFSIFLRYDNNVMTIWNMLIVVCNLSTESQLTLSRTDDFCLKTFDFIPYAILIMWTTQIMAWLFVSVQYCLKLYVITTISGNK